MELQVLQVLALCMQAKEKGHDCFFNYIPHVNSIEVTIYKNGWEKGKDCIANMKCKLITNEENNGSPYISVVTIETMIDYLTNLIKEENNG